MSFIDRPVPEGVVSDHTPLNFPLWYLRDLIVLVLLTPLLYNMRSYSTWVLAILTVICSYIYITKCEYQVYSLLFYSMGLYYVFPASSQSENSEKSSAPRIFILTAIFILLYLLSAFILEGELSQLVLFLTKIYLIPLYFVIAKVCVEKGFRLPHILTNSTFFIFCVHGLFIGWLKVIFIKVMKMDAVLPEIVMYLLIIIITLAISIALYAILNKFTPRMMKVLCGGR